MRLRIDLAYDGAGFAGWAAQPGLRTVQGELESALATVLRTPVAVVCAGRTDAGVHARGQVAHGDVDEQAVLAAAGRSTAPPAEALARRLNRILADDLTVHRVAVAPAGFDARFSALWRRYIYRIVDDPARLDPLRRGYVLVWPRFLDVPVMREASAGLVGEHDFAAFCKPRPGASTIRTLQLLSWDRAADGTLAATVQADAFCHHMVRSLIGCLVAIGERRRRTEWAAQVLAAGMRDPAVRVLPARGLTLEKVGYPPAEGLAARAETARAVRSLPSAGAGGGSAVRPG